MGNESSTPSTNDTPQVKRATPTLNYGEMFPHRTHKRPEYGYHVLKISPSSPGALAHLEPFFDFIVAADGQILDTEDTRLVDALSNHIGKPLRLGMSHSTLFVSSFFVVFLFDVVCVTEHNNQGYIIPNGILHVRFILFHAMIGVVLDCLVYPFDFAP